MIKMRHPFNNNHSKIGSVMTSSLIIVAELVKLKKDNLYLKSFYKGGWDKIAKE
jgi:hypothetical protein